MMSNIFTQLKVMQQCLEIKHTGKNFETCMSMCKTWSLIEVASSNIKKLPSQACATLIKLPA